MLDCELYIFIKSGKTVSPEFCQECPHYGKCNNFTEASTAKRLLIEDNNLLIEPKPEKEEQF